jgi:hypothetical protein
VNDDLRGRNSHSIPLVGFVLEASLDVNAIADPYVVLGELRLTVPKCQPVPIGTFFRLAVGGFVASEKWATFVPLLVCCMSGSRPTFPMRVILFTDRLM